MSERIFTTAFGEAKTRHVCTTADELNFDNYTECGIYNIYVDLGDGQSKMYSLIVDKSATGACTTQTRTCSGKTEYRYYDKTILTWSAWTAQSGDGGSITIDQKYNPKSANAQSGKAVAEALADYATQEFAQGVAITEAQAVASQLNAQLQHEYLTGREVAAAVEAYTALHFYDKTEIDTITGDIETALDSIIEIQNELMGVSE